MFAHSATATTGIAPRSTGASKLLAGLFSLQRVQAVPKRCGQLEFVCFNRGLQRGDEALARRARPVGLYFAFLFAQKEQFWAII